MIPIHLNPAALKIGLIGNGALTLRRLNWLRARDCEPFLWAKDPSAALQIGAGACLQESWPDDDALRALNILWVADLAQDQSAAIAKRARALKVIVNVEDDLPLCDFHTPAIVQRGQLTVSIGTAGASPAVAGAVRAIINKALPASWDEVLTHIATLRANLRAQGATPREIIEASKAHLDQSEVATQIAPCSRKTCVLLARAT